MNKLPDVQKSHKGFPNIYIEKVGVEGIKVNMYIKTKTNKKQQVLATINSFCSCAANLKGIHMSRFERVLHDILEKNKEQDDGFINLENIVSELKLAHGAKDVYIKASFDYIIDLKTPVTGIYSPEPVRVTIESSCKDNRLKTLLTVQSTEISLCPCSKEMSLIKNVLSKQELELIYKLPKNLKNKILLSGYGAHNQKSEISVTIENEANDFLWIEDVIDITKKSASAPTFSVLKRPDEKWVTEVSYMGGFWDNGKFNYVGGGPRFVEDISRNISEELDGLLDIKIKDYRIKVNNKESIHSDDISAVSIISAGRALKA